MNHVANASMLSHLLGAVLFLPALLAAVRPEPIGPFGGPAAIVEVDAHRGIILAATSNAMLFRSPNSGNYWSRVPFPPELRATLHSLVIVPQTGIYLAGLADDSHLYSGIFRSMDGGRSWARLPKLGVRDIWSIAVFPLDSRIIAAGAVDGVFLTDDGGEHWRRISPESNQALAPVVSVAFDTTDSRIVYAGTPHLPWKTSDGGLTWESAHLGMPDDSDIFSIHVDETRPLRLFASACSGLYHSTNQGVSWTKLAGANGASSRTYQITQDPRHPDVLFAGTALGLIRSIDRGKTWRRISSYLTRWISLDPTRPGRLFVATDDAGILRSDNLGESLAEVNQGFCNRRVLSFATVEDTLYASAAKGASVSDLFRLTSDVNNWEMLPSIQRFIARPVLQLLPVAPEHLFALTLDSLLRSSDGGGTWAPFGLPSPIPKVTAMLATAKSRRLLIGTEDGIWYTDDGGKIWRAARSPRGWSAIRSLVSVGTEAVAAITTSGLFVSSDGVNYTAVSSPTELKGLVATDQNGWLAATASGLVKSDNFGMTWSRVSGILDGSTVSAICRAATHRGVLFASRYGAIYASADEGRSWHAITPAGEELPAIKELTVTKSIPATIFAVTQNQGIYAISVASLPMLRAGP